MAPAACRTRSTQTLDVFMPVGGFRPHSHCLLFIRAGISLFRESAAIPWMYLTRAAAGNRRSGPVIRAKHLLKLYFCQYVVIQDIMSIPRHWRRYGRTGEFK